MRFPVSWLLAVCCAAAALAGCGSGSSGPDVLTAPIQVIRTPAGTVAYRELGSGPAVLLIAGAGISMDGWPPSMVDALAAHHEVVVFDNAGIGRTSAVSAPASLSVTAMTGQTSALITALGLRRAAVLGWSLGGMVAQDLAVSHPAQVSRLILAATAVGTGKAVPLPPYSTVSGLTPATVVPQLFPKNQAAALRAYLSAIGQYPGFYGVSAATFHSQYGAAERWLAGQDAAGRLVGDIRVPTLVAGGTQDQFIAAANDRLLASSVPGAKLLLFDDAGHAFRPEGHPIRHAAVAYPARPARRSRSTPPCACLAVGVMPSMCLQYRAPERLEVSTDCGLRRVPRSLAISKMSAAAEAARRLRQTG